MKILFKNTTKYTKENCDNLMEFHSNKYGKKELIRLLLLSICVLYILIFNLTNKNWTVLLGALIIGIIIYCLTMLKIKSEKKSNKRKKDKEYTFYFYEKHIKVKCKRQFERLKYFQLHKIFETDEYFFLYLDEENSLILDKQGFEVGTPKSFSKFIKNKCPFKYRNEKK